MNAHTVVVIGLLSVALLAFIGGMAFGGLLERRQGAERAAKAEALRRASVLQAQREQRAKPAWLKNGQAQPGTAGFTIAAALNGVGCLGRCQADEPVFVLCARDRAASMVVRDWASMAEKLGTGFEKIADARELADSMERWREQHGGGKVPD
jgi:hypothetical protein